MQQRRIQPRPRQHHLQYPVQLAVHDGMSYGHDSRAASVGCHAGSPTVPAEPALSAASWLPTGRTCKVKGDMWPELNMLGTRMPFEYLDKQLNSCPDTTMRANLDANTRCYIHNAQRAVLSQPKFIVLCTFRLVITALSPPLSWKTRGTRSARHAANEE